MHVGERIRALRTRKRVRQYVLARMVGITPGALTNFEKGRRQVSLDWLERIADALDTPIAYFLPEGRGEKKIAAGDLREKRLLDAWRLLKDNPTLQGDFLRIIAYSSHRERRFQSKLNSDSSEAERSSKR